MQQVKQLSVKGMQRKLWLLGFFKIPMLFFCRPRIVTLNEQCAKVRIRLKRRSKNHLGSMYFGALSVGADVAGGILAFYFAECYGLKISFAFKSFEAQFLQRAESDIVFVCNEGDKIKQMVEEAKLKGERINRFVEVLGQDKTQTIVARFQLELSVKVK